MGERRGQRLAVCGVLVILAVWGGSPALAGTATLSWTDAATNEAGYVIERATGACAATGLTWAEIGQMGANVTQYVDTSPVDGNRYCWRVRAWNLRYATDPTSRQYSAYSNLAGKDFLALAPAAPNLLLVN